MMKKVAIVTIIDFNYGNRLQNYALQTVLEKNGFSVQTLVFENVNHAKKLKRLIQSYLKKNRYGAFLRFDRRIHFSNYSVNSGAPFPAYYMKVIAGSDQVWNIEFPDTNENYFLAFAPVEKRFSYAASFGLSDGARYQNTVYQELLKEISLITVREKAGAEIIEKLTEKKAEVVLDPVFLLSREEWNTVAFSSIKRPKKPYIFCYFLGEYTSEYKEYIEKIAVEKQCEIFRLKPGMKDLSDDIGPAEFVDLIKNSVAVCADSYHAIVFSMIYDKEAYLFSRKDDQGSMNSRFETLFNLFQIRMDEKKLLLYDRNLFKTKLVREKKKSIEILLRGISQ